MKIVSVIFIMTAGFFIGLFFKTKKQNEFKFLIFLENFALFFRSEMILFKNDFVSIVDEFILKNNNLESFCKIFSKKSEGYIILEDVVKQFSENETEGGTVFRFLSSIGRGDYGSEQKNINSFLDYILARKRIYIESENKKGELFLKLSMAISGVIAILVW